MSHIPVLLEETIRALDPKPGKNFIDCTFGRGGHSRAILEMTAPDGRVLGLDWDAQSLENYRASNPALERLTLENLNFAELACSEAVKKFARIDGILFDLGMSSWDIDESGKGFAFSKDEPLDMRYDTLAPVTAAQIINEASAAELEKIFSEYGQERNAQKIAKAIIAVRTAKKIETTGQLAAIISKIVPPARRNASLARIFQALRLAVNRELEMLKKGWMPDLKYWLPAEEWRLLLSIRWRIGL